MRKRPVAELVCLADPGLTEDLVAALRAAGADAQRRDDRTIVVTGDEDLRTELAFFVRAWAGSARPVEFELESD
jgi:uncharacterized protein (UPF0218 family)